MLDDNEMGIQTATGTPACLGFVYDSNRVLGLAGEMPWQPIEDPVIMSSLTESQPHQLGLWQDRACFAYAWPQGLVLPDGYQWFELRPLMQQLPAPLFNLVGRGKQLLEWDFTHRFCGQCGGPMIEHDLGKARYCESCNKAYYPRVSPCIIVLITQGEKLLLANGVRHRPGVYSTVAGFIEPGETAEEAVHREVMEELGIRIKNLQYQSSQPWPFPHQLMLGYWAEYDSGELTLDPDEINDARWWHFNQLPPVPEASTMSGILINSYLDSLKGRQHA